MFIYIMKHIDKLLTCCFWVDGDYFWFGIDTLYITIDVFHALHISWEFEIPNVGF